MDDFGDFASFTAPGSSSSSITENLKESSSGNEQFNNNNVDFSFDAFQSVPFPENAVGGEMHDFGQFKTREDSTLLADGSTFEIPPIPTSFGEENFHNISGGMAFEIPPIPPYSPTEDNILVAGGVPFEIPPLPDLPFDDDVIGNGNGTENGMQSQVKGGYSDPLAMGSTVESSEPVPTWNPDFSGFKSSSYNQPVSSGSGSAFPNGGGDLTGTMVTTAVGEFSAATTTTTTGASISGDFGEFGGFSGNSVTPLTENSVATTTTAGGDNFGEFGGFSGNPVATTTAGAEDFGEFGGFSGNSVVTTTTAGGNDFGEFRGNPVTTTTTARGNFGEFGGFSGNSVATSTTAGGDDFGEFGGNSVATTTTVGGSDFGEFGRFSGNSVATTTTAVYNDFGEFGGFSGNSVATTTTAGDDDFGEFGRFSGNSVATTTTAGGDDFGEFGGFSGNSVTTTTTAGDDDFGEFGGFSGNSVATTTTAGGDDFEEFGGFSDSKLSEAAARKDNEFGGFSTASAADETKEFGGFSSASTQKAKFAFTPTVDMTKSSVDSLSVCFVVLSVEGRSSISPPPRTTPQRTLSQYLSKAPSSPSEAENQANKSTGEGGRNLSLWLVFQSCLDLTVPLHKFNNSYLQSLYYEVLSVDPTLVSRPSTLSILTGMAKFEDPLGGTTAVEDLRESFGFEGDMPQYLGSPTTEKEGLGNGRPARKISAEQAAAASLLDLSLPLSPNSPTRGSYTLTADLAGLDLNPQPQVQKLTSIQELLLNERLVVNRSTWMDSQLADLDGRGGVTTQEEPRTTSPSTPRSTTKANSLELQLQQLGLDVTKTTLPKASGLELSLTARSVLGRLPDLSFMLVNDKLENTVHYSRGQSK